MTTSLLLTIETLKDQLALVCYCIVVVASCSVLCVLASIGMLYSIPTLYFVGGVGTGPWIRAQLPGSILVVKISDRYIFPVTAECLVINHITSLRTV